MLAATIAVVAVEVVGAGLLARLALPHMMKVFAIRSLQVAVLLLLVFKRGGWHCIGLQRETWCTGIRSGSLISAAMGAAAAMGAGLLLLAHRDPLALIPASLPPNAVEQVWFFLAGGLAAPLAEELFFRGVLYGYFRRWGIVSAMLISTTIFVLMHGINGIPLTQTLGGFIFALAYETSNSLLAPIIIHSLGNLAIFGLTLWAIS